MADKVVAAKVRKGLEFNPRILAGFGFGMLVMCVGVYLLFSLSSRSFAKDATPTPFPLVDLSRSVSSIPGLIQPVILATPLPSATPILMTLSSECALYRFPLVNADMLGYYPVGAVLVPVGYWLDWFNVSGGWLNSFCVKDAFSIRAVLPLVSPPLLPIPTFTPSPTFTPTPTLTSTIYNSGVVRVIRPTLTPTPLPYKFSALPGGFNPGWCVKLVGVFSVWLPDGNVLPVADDGNFYFSSDALNAQIVYERSGDFSSIVFPACGVYTVR